MKQPETITIDDVKYIRVDSVSDPKKFEGDIKIAVLDRGFVYVGYVKVDHDFITITHAKNLRAWGTTKGLGELVTGPLSGTKLDTVGTIKVPLRALISLIDVEQTKWKLL